MSIIWIGRVSSFLTDNPIADRIGVKATAITAGAGSLVADKAQHTPELVVNVTTWLGITVVDWAAIFSILLTGVIFGEKIIKGLYKVYKWNKQRLKNKKKGGNDEL